MSKINIWSSTGEQFIQSIELKQSNGKKLSQASMCIDQNGYVYMGTCNSEYEIQVLDLRKPDQVMRKIETPGMRINNQYPIPWVDNNNQIWYTYNGSDKIIKVE